MRLHNHERAAQSRSSDLPDAAASINGGPIPTTIRRRRRRRARTPSVASEIQQTARDIYKSGFAEAMRAAALVIAARKLDEIRTILVAAGVSGVAAQSALTGAVSASIASPPPPITNPCVQCGRQGVYRSRPNQFNKTGSWYCRAHMTLGASMEAEDKMDRVLTPPAPPPAAQPELALAPAPQPGANSIAEAMGLAQLEEPK